MGREEIRAHLKMPAGEANVAAVLLIPRGLCGLGHVVRAHILREEEADFCTGEEERGALLRLPYPPF